MHPVPESVTRQPDLPYEAWVVFPTTSRSTADARLVRVGPSQVALAECTCQRDCIRDHEND